MLLLEQLSWQQSTSSSDAAKSSCHWMLQFPSQCILTVEAVLWERCVQNAVVKADKLELKAHW